MTTTIREGARLLRDGRRPCVVCGEETKRLAVERGPIIRGLCSEACEATYYAERTTNRSTQVEP